MRSRANRRVATALFIDVVDSTRVAADVGDRRWRELVASFRATVRRHLRRNGGREVDTAGDGFFATFDSPATALRAAAAIVAEVQERGLDVRCGLHTGELERIDGRLGGIGAHIAARVMAEAGPAEVYATATVRDLVVGGAADFDPLGERELKGVPGQWALHRLTAVDGIALPGQLVAADAATRRSADEASGGRGRIVALGLAAASVAVVAITVVLLNRQEAAGETPSASTSAAAAPVALVKLDPITRDITAEVRDVSLPPFGGEIQVVDGTLWLALTDKVTRRDLETGEVLATIDIPAGWWAVKFGFGAVWVGQPKVPDRPTPGVLPKISRFDAISGRARGEVETGSIFWDFAIGDEALYLIGEPPEVIEVDPVSLEIVDRDPAGTETQPHYISYENGHVWLAEGDVSSEFDPETGTIVRVVDRSQLGIGGGGTDPETGIIWMTDRGKRTITPFDPRTGEAERVMGLAGVPRGFAFGFDALWLAAEEYVYRIDSWSRQDERIEMPQGVIATGVAIDEETRTIWISTCAVQCDDFTD